LSRTCGRPGGTSTATWSYSFISSSRASMCSFHGAKTFLVGLARELLAPDPEVGGRDVEVRVASGDRSRRERERLTACQRRDRLHGKPLGRATRTTGKARAFLDLSRTRGRQSPAWRPSRVRIAEGPAGARHAGVAERSTSSLALPAMPLGDPASATSAVVTAKSPPRTTSCDRACEEHRAWRAPSAAEVRDRFHTGIRTPPIHEEFAAPRRRRQRPALGSFSSRDFTPVRPDSFAERSPAVFRGSFPLRGGGGESRALTIQRPLDCAPASQPPFVNPASKLLASSTVASGAPASLSASIGSFGQGPRLLTQRPSAWQQVL
jgi:hypothetical protein